jgi:hypothetical protein
MKHTTKRALVHLAGNDYDMVDPARLACTGEYGDTEELIGVESIDGGSGDLPDCPRCAVLWDEAIIAGELRKQKAMDHAAWVKADEDDNEKFWQTLKTGVPYRRMDR